MPSFMYNLAVKETIDRTLDLTTGLKIMLVRAAYVQDPDHTVVDPGVNDGTSPKFNEVVATNYTGGFGGAGRKAATLAFSVDNTNNRAVIAITDLTWTALGGATNDTVAAGVLIKEIGVADTTSRLVAYLDFTNTATNGSDFTLDFPLAASGGSIRFTT